MTRITASEVRTYICHFSGSDTQALCRESLLQALSKLSKLSYLIENKEIWQQLLPPSYVHTFAILAAVHQQCAAQTRFSEHQMKYQWKPMVMKPNEKGKV